MHLAAFPRSDSMVCSIPTFRSCSVNANAAREFCALHSGKYSNVSIFLLVGDLHTTCSYHRPSSLWSSSVLPCRAVVFLFGAVIITTQTASAPRNSSAQPSNTCCFRNTLKKQTKCYFLYNLCYCGTLLGITEEGRMIHPHPKLGQTCPLKPGTPPNHDISCQKKTYLLPYHFAFTCHEQIVPRSCHAFCRRDFLAIERW